MYLEMHNNSVFEIVYLKTGEHDREKDSNLFVACYFAGRTQYFASVWRLSKTSDFLLKANKANNSKPLCYFTFFHFHAIVRLDTKRSRGRRKRNIPESVTSLATGSTLAGFNEHICSGTHRGSILAMRYIKAHCVLSVCRRVCEGECESMRKTTFAIAVSKCDAIYRTGP